MFIKVLMLVVFFGIMVGIGMYCRRNATNVDGFVLGTSALFGKGRPFAEIMPELRAL